MAAAVLWLGTTLLPASAQQSTQDNEGEFWRDKTVTLVAPTAAGSGYDAYARLVARHLGKHLPGRPTVAVENMPGANGMVAANHVANIAPRDGSVIALLDRSVPTALLLYGDTSRTLFDPLRLNWLGSLARETGMGVVSTRAPAQTLEDGRQSELLFGAIGSDNDAAIYARLFNELLGMKIKVVPTYKAQPEIFLAIERDELHGLFIASYSGNARMYVDDQIAKGQMKLLVQMSMVKDPKLPDVPGVLDYATKEQDRQLVELLLSRLTLGRPFVAPPDVQLERLAGLRTAFEKMVQDPEFLADAQKSGLTIQPTSATEAGNLIRELYQYPKPVIERASGLVRGR